MPSALTSNIYDGSDMTLRKFALTCVTQLGAGYVATNQGTREMPLYEAPVIPLCDYHEKKIEEAKKELSKWIEISKGPEEVDRLYAEYVEETEKNNKKLKKRVGEMSERYKTMIEKVESWNVSERYLSLKELMLEQLNDSLDFDCYYHEFKVVPKDEFVKTKIESARKLVAYHTKEWEKELKRNRENNEYLKGLYEEIESVEPRT